MECFSGEIGQAIPFLTPKCHRLSDVVYACTATVSNCAKLSRIPDTTGVCFAWSAASLQAKYTFPGNRLILP
jgi:hypothetical protein